jgi:hypothetical protein
MYAQYSELLTLYILFGGILLDTIFPNASNILLYFLNTTDHVSHTYQIAPKVTVVYIHTSGVLETRWDDNSFSPEFLDRLYSYLGFIMNVLSVSDAAVLKSIFIIRLYKSNSCANIGIITVQGSYFLMVYTPDQKQKENT